MNIKLISLVSAALIGLSVPASAATLVYQTSSMGDDISHYISNVEPYDDKGEEGSWNKGFSFDYTTKIGKRKETSTAFVVCKPDKYSKASMIWYKPDGEMFEQQVFPGNDSKVYAANLPAHMIWYRLCKKDPNHFK